MRVTRHFLLAAAAAAASLLLGGCICLRGAGPGLWFVTEKQDGKVFEVRPGDRFTVKLPGNPTTGYVWDVLAVDPKMLEALGDAEFEADAEGRAGSGGTVILNFLAVKRGTTELRLGYRRPFETGVLPARFYSVTVVVK